VARTAAAQFELLREIFDLARAQRACLERDDIERVLDLMTEREAILERLVRLAEESPDVPSNVVPFPGAEDQAHQDSIALDTVIRGILEHDRHNEAMLVEKMQALHEELPRLQQGRRAAGAYRAAAGGRGSFMNHLS
jgi:hypothetical protein